MRITPSARRHGVADDDMLHAVDNAIRVFRDQGDHGLTLVIGPATNAALIEVGVVSDETGDRIVHAMPARRKYL